MRWLKYIQIIFYNPTDMLVTNCKNEMNNLLTSIQWIMSSKSRTHKEETFSFYKKKTNKYDSSIFCSKYNDKVSHLYITKTFVSCYKFQKDFEFYLKKVCLFQNFRKGIKLRSPFIDIFLSLISYFQN